MHQPSNRSRFLTRAIAAAALTALATAAQAQPRDAVTDLGVYPGDNAAVADAINNLGQVPGTSFYGTPDTWDATPMKPVVWRDGGVHALQSVLDPATGTGWVVASAVAVNNRGQIAVSAWLNGVARAALLTPLN